MKKYLFIILFCFIACNSLVFAQNSGFFDKTTNVYTIQLKSNPTTGYSWFITYYDHKLLTLRDHKYVPPKSDLVGAPGYEVWEFVATPEALKAPCVTTIKMVYARPWEISTHNIEELGREKVFNVTIK